MSAGPLPPVTDLIPGMTGRGVLCADPADADDIALALLSAGYAVAELDGRDVTDRRGAVPALAHALRLGEAVEPTLDALAGDLRQLRNLWAQADGVVLLWRAAEQFLEGDAAACRDVRDVLTEASAQLREEGFAFETVAFLAEYDVPPLLLGVPRSQGPRW